MAERKDCFAAISYYEKQYAVKYGYKPNVNRYKAQWGFDAILGGMNLKDVKELIDYYLTTVTNNNHDLEWFFYNYDKLVDGKVEDEHAETRRQRLKEESKVRSDEWKKTHTTLGE